MGSSTGTRRTFVGGALAGAALLGPVALVAPGRSSGVPHGGDALPPLPTGEIGHWTAAVGRRFRLAGADGHVGGTLTHVVPNAVGGGRPGPGRARAFRLHFTLGAGATAAGDGIYALDRSIAGLGELFMTRGIDAAGRAVLMAVIG